MLSLPMGGVVTAPALRRREREVGFPLANHFEQQYHVRRRLDRYGAGIAMDYATSTARGNPCCRSPR
jgi:hypothetical protein